MSEFNLRINLDNAAFEHGPMTETCRILRDVVKRIKAGDIDGTILDANGNRVGYYDTTGKD